MTHGAHFRHFARSVTAGSSIRGVKEEGGEGGGGRGGKQGSSNKLDWRMTEMAEQKLKLMECATMDKEKCVFLVLLFHSGEFLSCLLF